MSSVLGVTAPSSNVPEGDEAFFYIHATPASSTIITANYQTNPGTAIQDTDYQGVTGSVTIYPGQAYAVVAIPTFHDFATEPGETFSLAITGATGATVDPAGSSATVTIDDVPPSPPPPPPPPPPAPSWGTVTIRNPNPNTWTFEGNGDIPETAQSITFEVEFLGNSPGLFEVGVTTSDVTAKTEEDYLGFTDARVIFQGNSPNGVERKTVTVSLIDNEVVEGFETFRVFINGVYSHLGNPPFEEPGPTVPEGAIGYNAGDFAVGKIADDDTAIVSIVMTGEPFETDPGTANVIELMPTLSNPVDTNVTITMSLTDGTATAFAGSAKLGPDYSPVTGLSVTILAGELTPSAPLKIDIVPDNVVELQWEIFEVAFSTITFAGGEPRSVEYESSPDSPNTQAWKDKLIIIDDDQAVIGFTTTKVTHNEGQSVAAYLFTIRSMGDAVDAPFSVDVMTSSGTATLANSDYVMFVSTINFSGASGETHDVTVYVWGDNNIEADEFFNIGLLNVSPITTRDIIIDGVLGATTGIIVNDDFAIVSVAAATANSTVAEGAAGTNNSLSFVISLDRAADTDIYVDYDTIDGTAISTGAAQDYLGVVLFPLPTVKIPKGSTKVTVSVSIVGDNAVEPDEDFTFRISNARAVPTAGSPQTIGTSDATGTIVNDD